MRLGLLLSLMSGVLSAQAADICNPADMPGSYGFLLTGETTISGDAKPAVSLGRLVFDSEGGLSGTVSVKFAGLLLGNPVTGTYEAHSDCTVSWSLQDDSGGYQHFSGAATPGSKRVQFRQTDPDGAQNGVLVRTAEGCDVSNLRSKYSFTLSGTVVPMVDGGASKTVSAKGVMEQDGNRHFHLTLEGDSPGATDVAISVESDCIGELGFAISEAGNDNSNPGKFRAVLVDEGKEILAIQSDPGAIVSARFTARDR